MSREAEHATALSRSDLRGQFELMVVERSNPIAWMMMPSVMGRIRDFCEKYESDADPKTVTQTLMTHFVTETPGLVAILLMDGLKVLGHVLCSTEVWDGIKVCVVTQFETDVPLEEELGRKAFGWMQNWALLNGCKFIQCLTRNEVLARVFRTKYGFDKTMILMRKKLDNGLEMPAASEVRSGSSEKQ